MVVDQSSGLQAGDTESGIVTMLHFLGEKRVLYIRYDKQQKTLHFEFTTMLNSFCQGGYKSKGKTESIKEW